MFMRNYFLKTVNFATRFFFQAVIPNTELFVTTTFADGHFVIDNVAKIKVEFLYDDGIDVVVRNLFMIICHGE